MGGVQLDDEMELGPRQGSRPVSAVREIHSPKIRRFPYTGTNVN